jgi:hypothetical protein
METTTRGGARPGAGRKRTLPTEAVEIRGLRVTPAQAPAVRSFVRDHGARPWSYLVAGMDAAERHRPAEGAVYLSLSDGGAWQVSAAPFAEEVQLRVPAVGPVELFDDRSG